MRHKTNFTRLIQLWGIVVILGIATSITVVDILGSYAEHNRRCRQMRADYLAGRKQLIKQEVMRVVELISYQKSHTEALTEEKIKTKVYEAYAIAQNIYQQNKNTAGKAEIQKMIMEALRPIHFEHGSGYYFVARMDGSEMLPVEKSKRQRLNLEGMRDSLNQHVIKDAIKIAKRSGEGFHEYQWTKPGGADNKLKKISFIKLFEPYQWLIGTGLYVDDIEKRIEMDLLYTISRIRFGREGYLFINKLNGDALISNGKVFSGKQKLWEVFSKHPEKMKDIFEKELNAALTPDGDYIYYSHVKLTAPDKESKKVSFIYGIPQLQWLVGAGVYLDDVEKDIALMQTALTSHIKMEIFRFALIAFGIVAFFLFLFSRLNGKLKNDIDLFISFLNRSAFSSEPIDRNQVQFGELDRIAKNANKMLSDRRQTEDALRKSESNFRALVESSSDMIWEVNAEGTFTYVSPQIEVMLGYKPEEIIGKTPFDLMPEEEAKQIYAIFRELAEKGRPIITLKNLALHKNGEIVVLETSGVPFFDETGEFAGYRGVDRDITKRKKAEEELQKMQKLKSVGTLAGGVAHDFNNILTGLFGNIELAKLKIPMNHEAYPYIENALTALTRATHLTKQLLTFAKGGDPILKAVNLQDIVRTSVKFNLSGSNVKAKLKLPENLWQVKADKGQIDQVIANLTINAKQAMPEGGLMYIEAKNIKDLQAITLPHLSGDFVKLTIRDEGVGISAKYLERIFDPYFSTKQTGSGLGLATVHSIITKHKGHISVESTPDSGTTFTIFLPAEENAAESVTISSKETIDEPASTPAHILIMDDEKMVREVAAAMLETYEYTVDFAIDGKEALEKYVSAAKKGNPFDIVIMDLTIPGGMGGQETIKRLLAIDPKAKVVVSSGYSNDHVMACYSEYGFKGRITKPFRIKDMENVIKTCCRMPTIP